MNTSKALVNGQKQLLGIVRGMMGTMNLAAMAADGLQHAMEAIDRKAGDRMQRSMENVERAIVSVAAPLEDIGDKLKALASSIDAADKRMASFMGMGAGVSVSRKMPLPAQSSGPASVGAIDQASAASDRAELEAKIKQKVIPTFLKAVDTVASVLPKPKPGKPMFEVIRTTEKQLPQQDSMQLAELDRSQESSVASNENMVAAAAVALSSSEVQTELIRTIDPPAPALPNMNELLTGMRENLNVLLTENEAAASFMADNWSVVGSLYEGVNTGLQLFNALQLISRGYTLLSTFAIHAKIAATIGLRNAWATLNATMKANVIILVISLVTALIVWLVKLWQTNDEFAAAVMRAWNSLENLSDRLGIMLMRAWHAVVDGAEWMAVKVFYILEDLMNRAINDANNFIGLLNKIPGVQIEVLPNVKFAAIAAALADVRKRARADQIANMEAEAVKAAAKREQDVLDMLEDRAAKRALEDAEAGGSEVEKIESILPSEDLLEQDTQVTVGGGRIDEVGKVKDTVDISSEDLKTMRELAEMKNIQNFVTLQPSVNVQTGDIRNGMDVSSMVQAITTVLQEEIATSAQGVYE